MQELDPRIYQLADTPDVIAERGARLQAAQEKVQQMRQAAQDAAATRQAFQQWTDPQTGMTDYHKVIGQLMRTSPTAGANAQKFFDEHLDKMAQREKQEWENKTAEGKFLGGVSASIHDQAGLDAWRKGLHPEIAAALPELYDDAGKARLKQLDEAAQTGSERETRLHNAFEEWMAQRNFDRGTPKFLEESSRLAAKMYADQPNDQERADFIKGAPALGFPAEAIKPLVGATAAQASDMALTANERATRAQAQKSEADLNAYRGAEIGIRRQELGLSQQRENRLEKDAQGPEIVAPIDPNAPHGEAFLKTIPAQAAMVKALAEGKQPWPSSFALGKPYWQDLLNKVFQYDPTFDTAQASNNARVKTRVDFTSGASAKTINALNTVVGHIGNLANIGDKLGNSSSDVVNSVRNWLTLGGSERGASINNFDIAKQAVASELTRVYRQAGGSEKDIEGWEKSINAAKSPAELKGAWKTIGALLESKLEAMQTQVDQGLGVGSIQIVTPEARQNINRLTGSKAAPKATTPTSGKLVYDPATGGFK
jgi:hypothetical protein